MLSSETRRTLQPAFRPWAEPGSIVIAASTRRLLGDLFRLRDLGCHEVKGIAEPVAAWAVEGVSVSESRFEAVRAAGLTDLIGREHELDFLLKRQRLAWEGEGQIVLISGEPGIGKSRLAAALNEHIASEPHTRLRYQCSPYHTNSALHPFITQLERAAGFKADDTTEQRLDKLEALLAMGASRVKVVAPLFAALLSIPFGERYGPLALSPTRQRPPDARGTARSIRGSRPSAADPAGVRGRAMGGCHFPRASRSDRRAGAPSTGPCTIHFPIGVRAALGWSPQRQHLDARSPRP
jgi:hypothetical protein